MAAFLTPDKILTVSIGSETLKINQKIIPDSAKAPKDVASWCKKGQPMKPCAKLGGDGKPRGITVHNTGDIAVASGTNPAEQYTRATWPNCNMGGVVVHYYVYKSEIWQNLDDSERGWHAGDGSGRRTSHRAGQQIGGNMDTIAIEVIGSIKESEETAAKLIAYLCEKHGLDPALDIYTHNFFMGLQDKIIPVASKNCPIYILPHWAEFLAASKAAYQAAEYVIVTDVPGYSSSSDAKAGINKKAAVKTGSYKVYNVSGGMVNVTKTTGIPGSWINPLDNLIPASGAAEPAEELEVETVSANDVVLKSEYEAVSSELAAAKKILRGIRELLTE